MSDAKKAEKKPEEKQQDKKMEEVLPDEELSEDDRLLKEKLELLVKRLTDRDSKQRDHALEQLKLEIAGATKTMTSVPKPLKFLTPVYPDIVKAYES